MGFAIICLNLVFFLPLFSFRKKVSIKFYKSLQNINLIILTVPRFCIPAQYKSTKYGLYRKITAGAVRVILSLSTIVNARHAGLIKDCVTRCKRPEPADKNQKESGGKPQRA